MNDGVPLPSPCARLLPNCCYEYGCGCCANYLRYDYYHMLLLLCLCLCFLFVDIVLIVLIVYVIVMMLVQQVAAAALLRGGPHIVKVVEFVHGILVLLL